MVDAQGRSGLKLGKADETFLSRQVIAELMEAVLLTEANFRFQALGTSMEPTIASGDRLTVSPLKGTMPFAGEVVAFRHPHSGQLTLHRVLRRDKGDFLIRGDNPASTRDRVSPGAILGLVTRVERQGSAIAWPDRFRHPLLARLFFGATLFFQRLRRLFKRGQPGPLPPGLAV